MAKRECCSTCVYSYLDPQHVMAAFFSNFVVGARSSCANHPESLGRMRPVRGGEICPNYRPKPATPEGEVRQIPLGDGYYAYVDAADYEWLSHWTWRLKNGYAARTEKGKLIFMHRAIAQPAKGMIVDHKNRNKLDNTRNNLRACRPRENACNRGKRHAASSRFLGVSYCKRSGKWRGQVWFEGKGVPVGYFTDEMEAARAYDRKAVELFGASARLNFPEEWPPERRAEVHAQHKRPDEKPQSRKTKPKAKKPKARNGQSAAGRTPHNARRKAKKPRVTSHEPPRRSRAPKRRDAERPSERRRDPHEGRQR